MGRLPSITVPSIVGIVGRAPAVDEKVLFFAGRTARSAAMPVLFLLSGPKNGFIAPINVKFGTGALSCQISRLSNFQ